MANTEKLLAAARTTLRKAQHNAEDHLTFRERARIEGRKRDATLTLDAFDNLAAKHGERKALHIVTTAVDKYAAGVIHAINTAHRR